MAPYRFCSSILLLSFILLQLFLFLLVYLYVFITSLSLPFLFLFLFLLSWLYSSFFFLLYTYLAFFLFLVFFLLYIVLLILFNSYSSPNSSSNPKSTHPLTSIRSFSQRIEPQVIPIHICLAPPTHKASISLLHPDPARKRPSRHGRFASDKPLIS